MAVSNTCIERVSPQNNASSEPLTNKHKWDIVCPGVSNISIFTVLPTLILSPALNLYQLLLLHF